MREIKFKIWNKDKKCWCPDDYEIEYPENELGIIIKPDRKNVELLQYTGLKDKNGKEIYEGDIVKDSYEIGVVKFGNYLAGGTDYYAQSAYGFYVEHNPNFKDDTGDVDNFCEVIGNIYENPELLD